MTAWTPEPLLGTDVPGLMQVQLACYGPGFEESAKLYARRIASSASCSLVLRRGATVCAYLAAYRSLRGKVTPLHGDFETVPSPDTLYLHDMAVHPDFAGQGLAQLLVQALWQRALDEGLLYSGLVSVQGSQRYWERFGYGVCDVPDATQRASLASYGDDAVYMMAEVAR